MTSYDKQMMGIFNAEYVRYADDVVIGELAETSDYET